MTKVEFTTEHHEIEVLIFEIPNPNHSEVKVRSDSKCLPKQKEKPNESTWNNPCSKSFK